MSQMSPRVHTIAVIGLGLIGGSLAKATKQTGFAAHTMGYSLNFSEVKLGVELGVVDSAASSVEEAVKNADIVVVAVPVKAFESTLAEIKPYLKLGAILTDVGSVKGCFILAAEKIFGYREDDIVGEKVNKLMPQDISKGQKLGIFDYVTKPINQEKLLMTLHKALSAKH